MSHVWLVGPFALGLGGLALLAVGLLGWMRWLPRNRLAGVRTVSTLRDRETFAVGNRVAAPLLAAAGLVGLAAAAVLLANPGTPPPVRVVVVVVGMVGVVVLTLTGGVLGDRAARQVPPPAPPGGCSGCACDGPCSPPPTQD